MKNVPFTKKSVLFALFGLLLLLLPVACKDELENPNSSQTETGVTINGVTWATRNVDMPGTFAAMPQNAGMFYQWNRKKAWPATGEVTHWDATIPEGDTWAKANDPCPKGWRVPTPNEISTLISPIFAADNQSPSK